MQPLGWYMRRLGSMSWQEIAWRIRDAVRDVVDRPRFALRLYPGPGRALPGDQKPFQPGFRVTDVEVGEWSRPNAATDEKEWCRLVVERAETIAKHRLSFFDLDEVELGDPIDWNRDHAAGVAAPTRYAPLIDYRDSRVTGDCKLVWEPNRHHHLVVLGRAYRASGVRRYADEIKKQLESWWAQCPFGYGMNWRSPLELGIRLINWVWATDLIFESGAVNGEAQIKLLHVAYLHLWEVGRKFSRGSSANNHLIGEAAGVFVGASYFSHFAEAGVWRETAWAILCREIERQINPDGGSREQAIGYQLFVLQFFLVSALVAERTGIQVPATYRARLESMIEFLAELAAGGPLPMLGDADDGYVLDLERSGGLDGVLCAGAILFKRADWKAQAGQFTESARWLYGRAGRDRFEALPTVSAEPLVSRAFPETGLYLLQSGRAATGEDLSVVVDCGELGFGAIAAHGHADALSFTLRAFGVDVFVDPGTYDYFSYPRWRAYFRSTLAHNTVQVDGVDQSEIAGKFLWGSQASARCVAWEPRPGGGRVVGEHDGYLRLADPVRHRRTVELDGPNRTVTLLDEILTRGVHRVTLAFHLAEHCSVVREAGGQFRIVAGGGQLVLSLDPCVSPRVLSGSETPFAGWVSRGYHRRTPASTILATTEIRGGARLVSRIAATSGSGPIAP
jgi:Heparinase II/III-like protein/Heparinase II/III N-terminus